MNHDTICAIATAAGEGGIQKLTAQVLEEYQKPQAQKEPQQPQQVLQNAQPQVPEAPKASQIPPVG